MASIPNLEQALRDRVDALTPIDDIRATADYRRDVALTLVRRALASLC
ncbi:MAG TPA: hypothetical protein VMR89_00470 [Actinomycetota bacterium]|nr:hypothetical protein [Actinomycetota bacterium]